MEDRQIGRRTVTRVEILAVLFLLAMVLLRSDATDAVISDTAAGAETAAAPVAEYAETVETAETAEEVTVAAEETVSPEETMSPQELLDLAAQVEVPVLFGQTEETFSVDGSTFYMITVPQSVLDLYGTQTFAVLPMTWDTSVVTLKETLRDTFGENYFISDTQMRTEVIGCLDEQLSVLIETLYLFTGTERDICLDDFSWYLLTHMDVLSSGMQTDIHTVYKYLLISRGLDGSLSRTGYAEGLYYYAQTDDDWASYPFPNTASSTEYYDTMKNRSCGVMSVTMVAATYLHHELDPTILADYVVDNGYRIEGSGVDDTFFLVAADYYGIPEPTIYYNNGSVDWDLLADQVGNQNYLAIVHMYTGPFTSNQHYMVLEDYQVIDGTGYFLVADPYVLRSRYTNWDQLLDPGTGNDGLIYATPYILNATCSAVTVFAADKTAWDMTAQATGSENILVMEVLGNVG